MCRGRLHLRIEHARANAALLLVQQHRADLIARELPGATGVRALEGASQLGLGKAAQLELAEEARGEAGVEVLGVGGGEAARAAAIGGSRLLSCAELAGAGALRWSWPAGAR